MPWLWLCCITTIIAKGKIFNSVSNLNSQVLMSYSISPNIRAHLVRYVDKSFVYTPEKLSSESPKAFHTRMRIMKSNISLLGLFQV